MEGVKEGMGTAWTLQFLGDVWDNIRLKSHLIAAKIHR